MTLGCMMDVEYILRLKAFMDEAFWFTYEIKATNLQIAIY